MSPIYAYRCPYGHSHEALRRYEDRMNSDPCPTCGAPTDYVISAHHRQPDGIYSYSPNIGNEATFERHKAKMRGDMDPTTLPSDAE